MPKYYGSWYLKHLWKTTDMIQKKTLEDTWDFLLPGLPHLPGVWWDYKAGHLQRLWPHTQTPDPASPEYQRCSHFHPLGESLLPPKEFHFSPFTKTNKQIKSIYSQEQFITFLEEKHFFNVSFIIQKLSKIFPRLKSKLSLEKYHNTTIFNKENS